MKIVLFGANGQVGRELKRSLLPHGEVIALQRAEADLCDLVNLKTVLEKASPALIVNASAYTAVDKAESEKETAMRVNADAVGVMADFAAEHNVLLVHYSTDYVFDGQKEGEYDPADSTNPQNVYGLSKLKGEENIKESGCDHLIFRTSWVYSCNGNNFIKTMLRLAKDKASLNVVADQVGAPTSAELIADITSLSLLSYYQGNLQTGLYHLAASGHTSWHGLACYAIERAANNGALHALTSKDIQPITTAEYPTPAKRPENSRLGTLKLESALNIRLPKWEVYVDRMVDQLTLKEELA